MINEGNTVHSSGALKTFYTTLNLWDCRIYSANLNAVCLDYQIDKGWLGFLLIQSTVNILLFLLPWIYNEQSGLLVLIKQM